MKRVVLWLAVVFFELILKIRYSIRYKGLERVKKSVEGKGALFLSNHPALFVDGLTVGCPLIKSFSVRTLIIEYMFFTPVIGSLLRWIRAIPVPNFGTGSNAFKLHRLHKALHEVSTGLKTGENFLLFPAGMTKQTGKEILGGTFAVHDILKEVPECPVVLIRVVGLWGSRFSRAQHRGEPVQLGPELKRSFLDVVKALFFFMPRRKVEVTFEIADNLPRKGSRSEINHWLESWFNAPFEKGEPLTLVSYSPWKYKVPDIEAMEEHFLSQVPPELKQKVFDWIEQTVHIPQEQIKLSSHLIADLGLDSLALAELITYCEAEMDVPRILPQDLSTVASLLLAVQGKLKSSQAPAKEWDMTEWFAERRKKRITSSFTKLLPDQFLKMADKNPSCCIAADDSSGPVTYRKLKRSLLILAYHIQKLPGKRVGILLPDTIAAHILTLACLIAGKTPVLLNWTVGGKSLKTVSELACVEKVLASFQFLDLLENVDLSPIQEKILCLEEFKASFSLMKTAFISALSRLPYRSSKYSSLFPHWRKMREEDEAVLLFTSGTESEPKGVPLTHKNILSNLQAALESIELYSTDRLMSILPPFHSFGFSVTGMMPLLSGLPVFFFPNPTDGGTIADKMRVWKSTLVCSAPSFLKNILLHAKKDPLVTLRLMVTGAEKAADDFFSLCPISAPHALVYEGYGITECSPILTVNTTGKREEGVGRPLKNVHIQIVNPDDFSEKRSLLEDGMILASGPNVFSGYLQSSLASPFFEENGVRWYVTGDLGHLTKKGSVVITGRLKRFVKIGGEMIGLSAIEEGLTSLINAHEEGPSFAVVAVEEAFHIPKLVLIAKQAISLTEANLELRKKGFSNLIRLDKVLQVESIPVTATGKVSLRDLIALAKQSYASKE